jgi:hypothetical protein
MFFPPAVEPEFLKAQEFGRFGGLKAAGSRFASSTLYQLTTESRQDFTG